MAAADVAPAAITEPEDALVTDGLVAGYGGGDVLRGISFGAQRAGITAIIGPNGAGKSTLLAAIIGLLRPRAGRVLVAGREITGTSPERALAAGITIVPQARSLFPDMTVLENVELGGYTVRDRRVFAGRLSAISEMFPAVTQFAHRKAGRLSGGQQRMVEFARSLMLDPSVILLDEPSMGLDPASLRAVYDAIVAMRAAGKTVVLVEQNARAALEVADRAVLLEAGLVRLTGPAQELLDHPDVGRVYLGRGGAPGGSGPSGSGVSPGSTVPPRASTLRRLRWDSLPGDGAAEAAEPEYEDVPFGHPLWVLYSSGTTGLPKPIVHSHGGIVLEHLKALTLHQDLGAGDVFFWFTTTGWMMWNYLAGGLLAGATVVQYDGSATYPGPDALWQLASETGVTYFGTGAPYLLASMKAGLRPAASHDLSRLRGIGSTGSPLPPEGFRWVYDAVVTEGTDVILGSFSGGTDLCTGFVGPCPLLPVRAGVISGRCLGASVEAYDAAGRSVVGEVGELVITQPMPSMPVGFWNDPGGERYRASYFAEYPGVWRHGDWIMMLPDGSSVIYGRSDATLNRGGVRMGTSEFYRVVETMPEIADSLVIDTGRLGQDGRLILYVVPAAGHELDDGLVGQIRSQIRSALSPRHVPDEIHQVPGIPRTLSGKKLEVPVRKILLGTPLADAADPDALANPEVLAAFAPRAPGG
jgi:acyl-coenzyme A synthetase/AMP-(fatty) acid ligase/ABC-type branched-subunit amino acid transport system ATPase component